MSMKSVLPVLTAMLVAQAALAAEIGFYAQTTGAYSMPGGHVELDNLESDGVSVPDIDLTMKHGWMGAVALGYDWGPFRLEGEGAYRQNAFDDATSGTVAGTADGNLQATSLMANAIFEVPAGKSVALYFGFGGGVAAVHVDTTYSANFGPNLPAFDSRDVDVETGAIPYQLLAGVEFNLSDNLTLNVGYRLWSCLHTEFNDNFNDNPGQDLEGDLRIPVIHSVEVGLRYTL